MEHTISMIETSRISANPNNPRARIEDVSDLVSSIKNSGLLQPITVRWTKKLDADGMPAGYEVIAGSRRFTACQALKMDKIPCIVRQADDAEAFKLATLENIVRENMTAVDEANAVAKLYEQGHSRQEIASIFGKSVRWAEGRRKIVSLGDKAMEALAAGSINLGHAEVLTLCSPDRVERWLDAAKWNTPAQLKNMILNERKRLDKAPFNVNKICKNCENRSDCQQELFGDVTDSYCLDESCYAKNIEKEVERIRKNFEAQGWLPVPEEDAYDAENGYSYIYIDVKTEDEEDQETIKKWKAAGVKPRYWINETTAANGLVFSRADYNEIVGEIDENEEEENEHQPPLYDYSTRNEIRQRANKLEEESVSQVVNGLLANLSAEQVALLLTAFSTREYEYEEADEDGETHHRSESLLQHIGEELVNEDGGITYQRHALLDAVVDGIIVYGGVREIHRAYFCLAPREEIEKTATEMVMEERKRLEAEAAEATQSDEE